MFKTSRPRAKLDQCSITLDISYVCTSTVNISVMNSTKTELFDIKLYCYLSCADTKTKYSIALTKVSSVCSEAHLARFKYGLMTEQPDQHL